MHFVRVPTDERVLKGQHRSIHESEALKQEQKSLDIHFWSKPRCQDLTLNNFLNFVQVFPSEFAYGHRTGKHCLSLQIPWNEPQKRAGNKIINCLAHQRQRDEGRKEGGEEKSEKERKRNWEMCFECTCFCLCSTQTAALTPESPTAKPFRDLSQSPGYLWSVEKQLRSPISSLDLNPQ